MMQKVILLFVAIAAFGTGCAADSCTVGDSCTVYGHEGQCYMVEGAPVCAVDMPNNDDDCGDYGLMQCSLPGKCCGFQNYN